MAISRTSLRPTSVLAGSATFGALAALITLAAPPALQLPFPILFYLKFDVAEVVDVSSFMIFGPTAGLLTAGIHALILGSVGGGAGFGPFGASLKFFGVLTTYVGLWLASRFGKSRLVGTGLKMTFLSLATRVSLMTVVNYLYIIFLAQVVFGMDYLGYPQFLLSQVGISVSGAALISYVLALTAVYNAVHVIFSVVVSLLLVNTLLRRAPNLLQTGAWITKLLSPASRKTTYSSQSEHASS
jgi:riboflavin transporter